MTQTVEKRKKKRRGWDSNPRDGSTPPTRFPVALLRPTRTPLRARRVYQMDRRPGHARPGAKLWSVFEGCGSGTTPRPPRRPRSPTPRNRGWTVCTLLRTRRRRNRGRAKPRGKSSRGRRAGCHSWGCCSICCWSLPRQTETLVAGLLRGGALAPGRSLARAGGLASSPAAASPTATPLCLRDPARDEDGGEERCDHGQKDLRCSSPRATSAQLHHWINFPGSSRRGAA